MPVGGLRDGDGDQDTCGVDGLPDVQKVHSTSNFLDENCGQTFSTETLVYT